MTIGEQTTLVENAQNGCQTSLNRLAEGIRPRLEQYVYRLTLDRQLTQDVVQETLTIMVKALGKLEKTDRFWPFLRKIALYKARDAQKAEIRRRDVHDRLTPPTIVEDNHLAEQINRELKEIVVHSMQALQPDHRQVLTLRCYEEMDYSEIAAVMDRSPFAARMLFVRAKKALQKQLARHGVRKATLLTALIIFGKITATSEAAAAGTTVAAGSLKAGVTAGILAAFMTKIAAMVLMAATIMGGGLTLWKITPSNSPGAVTPAGQAIQPAKADFLSSAGLTPVESWFYFPSGPQGPVLRRLSARRDGGEEAFCRWVYDGATSRCCDPASGCVYILNCNPLRPDLSVTRLPGDGWELTRRLDQIEGRNTVLPARVEEKAGLWCIADYTAPTNQPRERWTITQRSNLPLEDCFRHPWAVDVREIDKRDEAHRRGRTFFTVTGEINEQNVSGRGYMPLNAAMAQHKRPWIELTVGGASVNANFTGLGRPWTGLHTIDTIRRDVARCGYTFTTKLLDDSHASIEITNAIIYLTYTVNLNKDLLESIDMTDSNGQNLGRLDFNYTETIDNPDTSNNSRPEYETSSPHKLWLRNLVSEK